MDPGNTKKRDRSIIEEDPIDKSPSKRQKTVEIEEPIQVLVPTLVIVGSEYENENGAETFLALHKTKEDRDGFFKWMKSLDDDNEYFVVTTMMGNEDPNLIVEEMEMVLKKVFEEDSKKKKKHSKKIEDELRFFFGQERKKDFLGLWVHQDHLTLNGEPKPFKTDGKHIDLSQLLAVKATDFC